ncbi:unnamed protein product [Ceutorhynchus assimilis]|uniref:C2 NT-type domain-containing protein n=1 Tax=Ceutorhynchus assimilis TaxID=467358 RepID=A0A9P0GNJ4_9CUCU|nr:unnamed protein product [Ceutorhynchus assimilis]
MTSFMSKKKKYKFQVEICLEELLEVPFVSAVFFAKLRLLDGGNFLDYSSRQEVRDHKVSWEAKFSFPCKMMANASTGVMEKCIVRISIRKESKGGRSFTKLGFVDLNLAEYAGAGLIHKKALLEGYDARHRQDNSMLKFRIQLNMISGDIVFKAPCPSLKHKQIPMDETSNDQRSDEFSSGSLAGSINSGSSGFGSLPKKRTPLPSELVIGQTLTESGLKTTTTTPQENSNDSVPTEQLSEPSIGTLQEQGHSRNSSNTSQMSKGSGYSSISHSRQSSSGDSTAGHIRNALQHDSLRRPISTKFHRTYTFPKHRLNIPTTIHSESPILSPNNNNSEAFYTPESAPILNGNSEVFFTPESDFLTPQKQDLDEVFETPNGCYTKTNIFDKNFNALQKSASSSVVERIKTDFNLRQRKTSEEPKNTTLKPPVEGVLRSKSDFIIPKLSPLPPRSERTISNIIASFITPRLPRKGIAAQSTPNPLSRQDSSRAVSMGNLKLGNEGNSVAICSRNPSSGSLQTTNSDTGSLDRAKAAYERRKKLPNSTEETSGVSGRVEITRINPEDFIADLLKDTNLEQHDDSAETSGLQLFIAKDGTASLGNHEVKSQMSTGINSFKQVVMDNR